MIYANFSNKDKRFLSYSEIPHKSENNITKQVSESELNSLIPDGFDADNWKEVRRHYKLEDGEVVFDEDYEPETEEQ